MFASKAGKRVSKKLSLAGVPVEVNTNVTTITTCFFSLHKRLPCYTGGELYF